MTIFYEVRSSSKPDGEGKRLEPSRYASQPDAESAARRESAMGFFSSVWLVENGRESYLCEFKAVEVAA